MKYLLDSNIISELSKAKPDPGLTASIAATALANQLVVVTRDTADFPLVQVLSPFPISDQET